MGENGEICHFLGKTREWYWYQKLVPVPLIVVLVPIDRGGLVPVPVVSGTGTHLQNKIGTGTD